VQTCIWPSWCHCHSLSVASVKSRLVLPFWYRLTWVVPEKGPLNGCVTVEKKPVKTPERMSACVAARLLHCRYDWTQSRLRSSWRTSPVCTWIVAVLKQRLIKQRASSVDRLLICMWFKVVSLQVDKPLKSVTFPATARHRYQIILLSDRDTCVWATELYILWSELSHHKLSPTLATAHYSLPDNAIGLVAQCELSGYVKLG